MRYKEEISNGTKPPAYTGNFEKISATFAPKLKMRELQRINRLRITLNELLTSVEATVTTVGQLGLLKRGVLYRYLTKLERWEFWERRFPDYCYEYLSGFKGWCALDKTLSDPVSSAWWKHVFALVMDSLWCNHIVPKMKLKCNRRLRGARHPRLVHQGEVVTQELFRLSRAILTYGGIPPTLDNVFVFKGKFSRTA